MCPSSRLHPSTSVQKPLTAAHKALWTSGCSSLLTSLQTQGDAQRSSNYLQLIITK